MSQTRTRRVRVEDADLRAAAAALLMMGGRALTPDQVRFEFHHCERSPANPDGYMVTALAELQESFAPPEDAGEVGA